MTIRKYIIFVIIIIFLLLSLISYNSYNVNNVQFINYYKVVKFNKSELKLLNNNSINNNVKTILLWNSFFSDKYWGNEENTVTQNCSKTKNSCVITTNHSYFDQINMFDSIIFHGAEEKWHILDTVRSPHQIYVLAILESPENTRNDLTKKINYFNWTMTYRLDSDVVWPYAVVEDSELRQIAPANKPLWRKVDEDFYDDGLMKVILNKTKMAAWFVSNCETASNRDMLVMGLQKFMSVDIYGVCGPLKCPMSDKCDVMLDNDYKFYLSFENSLCRDYVTEKLFKNINRTIIPIVFGGADYNKFVPPKSYINANDFETPYQLAEYLHYLDKNPKEYLKYFWWKKYYKIKNFSPFCQLCDLLHTPKITSKIEIYEDINDWWSHDVCQKKPHIKF